MVVLAQGAFFVNVFATSRRLVLALTLIVAAASAQAQADSPEARREAARALSQLMLEMSSPEKMLAGMIAAIKGPMEQQVRQDARLSAAQQSRVLEVLLGEMELFQRETMRETLPQMLEAMSGVYADRFTLAEIADLRRFYVSDLGRKSMSVFIDDMPRMMQPVMSTMTQRMPFMQQRMAAAVKRLRDEGIPLQ